MKYYTINYDDHSVLKISIIYHKKIHNNYKKKKKYINDILLFFYDKKHRRVIKSLKEFIEMTFE